MSKNLSQSYSCQVAQIKGETGKGVKTLYKKKNI